MARAKKSSLDTEEPVVVEGEETVMETAVVEEEPAVVKAEEKPAVTEKETKKQKAEAQEKPKTESKAKRGVKICVI